MTDAPERITASPSRMKGWVLGYCTSEPVVAQAAIQPVEYIRADTAQARIAELEAALREVLEVAEDMMSDYGPTDREHMRHVQAARLLLAAKP
jgi:hypothetical protein